MIGFFFQAEDGIRDLVRARGLGDVYKRQSYIRGALTQCRAVLTLGSEMSQEADVSGSILMTLSGDIAEI